MLNINFWKSTWKGFFFFLKYMLIPFLCWILIADRIHEKDPFFFPFLNFFMLWDLEKARSFLVFSATVWIREVTFSFLSQNIKINKFPKFSFLFLCVWYWYIYFLNFLYRLEKVVVVPCMYLWMSVQVYACAYNVLDLYLCETD